MQWERPSYTFVNMSAEIGGYQDDLGRRGDPATGEPDRLSGSLEGRSEKIDPVPATP